MLGLRVALKASGGRTRDRTLQPAGPSARSGGPTGHVHRPLPGAPPPGLHPGHHRPHGLLHPGHHRGVWLPRGGEHREGPPHSRIIKVIIRRIISTFCITFSYYNLRIIRVIIRISRIITLIIRHIITFIMAFSYYASYNTHIIRPISYYEAHYEPA